MSNKHDSNSHHVNEKMAAGIKWHFPHLEMAELQTYTFTTRHSDRPDAKADLELFDQGGAMVMMGREFSSGKPSYWLPTRVTLVPERPEPTPAVAAIAP